MNTWLNELLNLSLKRLSELNGREFVACGPQAGQTGKVMPEGRGRWRTVVADGPAPGPRVQVGQGIDERVWWGHGTEGKV